jgi:hypothetical protein
MMKSQSIRPRNFKLPSNPELRVLAERGWGRVQIAGMYGATVNQVTDRLRNLGLTAPMDSRPRPQGPSKRRSTIVQHPSGSVTLAYNSMHALATKEKRA